MSEPADAFTTGRQPRRKATISELEFAAAAIFAILVVAQVMLVAQSGNMLDTAAQFAPFGIFAP
jgi:hypothetical protein